VDAEMPGPRSSEKYAASTARGKGGEAPLARCGGRTIGMPGCPLSDASGHVDAGPGWHDVHLAAAAASSGGPVACMVPAVVDSN
jgi:hypothetical protein